MRKTKMAEIQFTAFVEDVLQFGMKTSEPHKQQIDGEWKTISRTYRFVKESYGTTIDFTQFAKGDLVKIVGKESTKVREYEGKKYYDLVCKADSVTKMVKSEPREFSPVDTDAPF
jgi:hypothetical protein